MFVSTTSRASVVLYPGLSVTTGYAFFSSVSGEPHFGHVATTDDIPLALVCPHLHRNVAMAFS